MIQIDCVSHVLILEDGPWEHFICTDIVKKVQELNPPGPAFARLYSPQDKFTRVYNTVGLDLDALDYSVKIVPKSPRAPSIHTLPVLFAMSDEGITHDCADSFDMLEHRYAMSRAAIITRRHLNRTSVPDTMTYWSPKDPLWDKYFKAEDLCKFLCNGNEPRSNLILAQDYVNSQ